MASCIRCGGHLDELDAGGDMVCQNCEAAGGAGGTRDVPCQRCGMYLPPHELRMHNSRLYCAYCIMDMQDEERHGKEGRHVRHEGGCSIHGSGNGWEAGLGALGSIFSEKQGVCERCGIESRILYSLGGRRLCGRCYDDESGDPVIGGASGAPVLQQIAENVKRALGIWKKPDVIPAKQPDVANNDGNVFDLRKRKMVKEGGIEGKEPLHEKKRWEKKPSKKSKAFFALHPSEKKSDSSHGSAR